MMLGVRERIEQAGDDLRAIAAEVEAGRAGDHDATSFLAAIALVGLGRDLGPPLIRSKPPRTEVVRAASATNLGIRVPGASPTDLLTISAGLLQILDDWQASHEAAQAADDLGERGFSAWWHAIAHRREPDAGNAAYWFRRVGRHAAFAPLADAVSLILAEGDNSELASHLLKDRAWNPLAFVDYCGQAAKSPGSLEEVLARRIQRAEMLILLDATCADLDFH